MAETKQEPGSNEPEFAYLDGTPVSPEEHARITEAGWKGLEDMRPLPGESCWDWFRRVYGERPDQSD